MIKIGVLRQRQKEAQQRMTDIRIERMSKELSEVNWDISDENCIFKINEKICVKQKFIAIQIMAKPLIGLYNDIDFLTTLYYERDQSQSPPKIVNNRRVFHPNLNPYTFQWIFPELADWIPCNSLLSILKKLKYTITQPNGFTIHNNPICKKAAYLYKIDRVNYRNYIIQFCPTVLDNIIVKQYSNKPNCSEMQNQKYQKKYVELNDILPSSRLVHDDDKQDDNLQILNKRLSKIKIHQSIQTKKQDVFEFHSIQEQVRKQQ